jgi:hypothetical protein
MAQGNLGVLFNSLRGKAGSVVFARSKDGTVVRPRVSARNPQTPAQQAVRLALSKSATAYKNLTAAQVTAWTTYANNVTKHDPRTGKTYHPSAIAAFTSLAAKFLQVNPAGTVPLTPPVTGFAGDTITATAVGAAGKVTFTGSAANGLGITTELLLQPLKSQNRKPQPKGYRGKGFKAFAAGSLTQDVLVPAGWYVPAYRFVYTATGQDTLLVILPAVQAT